MVLLLSFICVRVCVRSWHCGSLLVVSFHPSVPGAFPPLGPAFVCCVVSLSSTGCTPPPHLQADISGDDKLVVRRRTWSSRRGGFPPVAGIGAGWTRLVYQPLHIVPRSNLGPMSTLADFRVRAIGTGVRGIESKKDVVALIADLVHKWGR